MRGKKWGKTTMDDGAVFGENFTRYYWMETLVELEKFSHKKIKKEKLHLNCLKYNKITIPKN